MTNEHKRNDAHVARVRGNLASAAARLGVPVQEDTDDLDVFDYADVAMGNVLSFRIFKYRGIEEDVIDIMFQSQRKDWRDRLSDVLQILKTELSDILWINEGYFNTP